MERYVVIYDCFRREVNEKYTVFTDEKDISEEIEVENWDELQNHLNRMKASGCHNIKVEVTE